MILRHPVVNIMCDDYRIDCCIYLSVHTATHCNTLQHTATHCNTLHNTVAHCITPQHTATHCNTLRHIAKHCNTLQHTAFENACGLRVGLLEGSNSRKKITTQCTHIKWPYCTLLRRVGLQKADRYSMYYRRWLYCNVEHASWALGVRTSNVEIYKKL